MGPFCSVWDQERPTPTEGGDVVEDEENAEVAGESLEGVAEVILVFVVDEVVFAAGGVVDAEDAVEGDGEPKGDFGEEEVWDLGVDPGHFMGEILNAALSDGESFTFASAFEGEPAPCERGVGDKVDDQEDPDGEDSGQRVEPTDEELVSLHEACFGCGMCAHGYGSVGLNCLCLFVVPQHAVSVRSGDIHHERLIR